MADIFYNGRIYVGINKDFEGTFDDWALITKYNSYPCPQPNPFKDGEDVTGKFELKDCSLCEGNGWVVEVGCCNKPTEYGNCCGSPIPVQTDCVCGGVPIAIPLPPTTATDLEGEAVDKLLQPRYLVIALWPFSNPKIALRDIFKYDSERDVLYSNKGEVLLNEIPDMYPHLFRKLSWWEMRSVEEMPEYLKTKHDGVVSKVVVYDFDTNTIFIEAPNGSYQFSLKAYLSIRIPATLNNRHE